MLSTLANASYTASPRWLRVASRLLILIFIGEMALWCATFGPVPGAVYPIIALIGIYLSEFLLISMHHAPTLIGVAGKSLTEVHFEKQWDTSGDWIGFCMALSMAPLVVLFLVMGFGSWASVMLAFGIVLLFAVVAFFQTPRLLCWLYCLRHHQSWEDE